MPRFKQGDWVVFNDTGLESCYGQSHTLQHMKTLAMQIVSVESESMTGDDEPTHLVQVNDEAINTFMLTDWDFDEYTPAAILDDSFWDDKTQPVKKPKKTALEKQVLKDKADEFEKVLIALVEREAKLRKEVERELYRRQVANPNQIIADDFYGAPIKKGEIKW
jgi:hypothetical protein